MPPRSAGSRVEGEARLHALLAADGLRVKALQAVRSLGLSNGWIGAGFVRDAMWDNLHGLPTRPPAGDVDVLFHDERHIDPARDAAIEHRLWALAPGFDWSVKNQARMHIRNGDAPYLSVAVAMRHWPETATAIAVRLNDDDGLEINAPFGLDDLFAPRLRPTPAFMGAKRPIFDRRVRQKRWLERYPLLRSGPP